jgi:hypothetical protein
MDKIRIIKAVVDKIKLTDLFEDLVQEKNPTKSKNKFQQFMKDNKIEEKAEIQKVLSFLKTKRLFNTIFENHGMEPVWQQMKKEFDLKGFLFLI